MPKAHPARRAQRPRHPLWRLVRANFYDLGLLLRESWVALAGFAILALAGTLYLHYTHPARLGFAAALFETLKLVSLQTGLDLPDDLLGKALFFLIPLLGLALIFQSVLNFGRLLLDKGSRREAWQVALASTYRDHIIVCGLGRVGMRVVEQLLESGFAPVVIERDWRSQFVERALNLKVPVVAGDAHELATLRQAGLPRARAVVATINGDLTNIEIALTARGARPGLRVVLRIFSDELDRNLERAFGPNTAFSASALAAPTYVAATVSREIDYALAIGGQLLGVTRLALHPDGRLLGPAPALEQEYGVRVLRQERPDGVLSRQSAVGSRQSVRPLPTVKQIAPNPYIPLLAGGDQVLLLGPLGALEALRMANQRAEPPARPQHPGDPYDTIIVCGLGKVGYRVVQQLARLVPRPRIVVVRLDDGRPDFGQHIGRIPGVTVIIGDARDPEVLRSAGIARAFTIAALTSDDLLNLQISLAARQLRPDVDVVQRAFSYALAEKLADVFGVRTVYSTSGLASPTLAAAAVLGDITHAFAAGDRLYSSDQITVSGGDALAGRSAAAIRAQHGALLIALCRSGEWDPLPPLDTTLQAGDTIELLADLGALARLRALLVTYSRGQKD